MLSREATHALDRMYYDRETQYVDEAFTRSGLLPWEEQVIDQFFRGCKRLAVVGAGGGREVLALLDRGYEVRAFECHPKFVDFGNLLLTADGFAERIVCLPRDRWPASVEGCDGAVVGWGSYMLMRGRATRVAFLRQARLTLPVGSPILLSFFTRSCDFRYLRISARVGNVVRHLRRDEPVEVGDALGSNFLRYFARHEVEAELREAGFDMVYFETEDYGRAVGVAAPS